MARSANDGNAEEFANVVEGVVGDVDVACALGFAQETVAGKGNAPESDWCCSVGVEAAVFEELELVSSWFVLVVEMELPAALEVL